MDRTLLKSVKNAIGENAVRVQAALRGVVAAGRRKRIDKQEKFFFGGGPPPPRKPKMKTIRLPRRSLMCRRIQARYRAKSDTQNKVRGRDSNRKKAEKSIRRGKDAINVPPKTEEPTSCHVNNGPIAAD